MALGASTAYDLAHEER